jgi:2-phosphoglycerate kinase
VLSFYEEAISETTSETYTAFVDNQKKLYKLTRRNHNNRKPLVMFITGPAGAGKCKS